MVFFMCVACMVGGFNLCMFKGGHVWTFLLGLPVVMVWGCLSIAETNRTPFDFAEGESELVSGFNVEYGRGGFALIFLAEYGRIIFIGYLMVLIFLGDLNCVWGFNAAGVIVSFIFVWVRGTLPRLRYDKLIEMA